MSAPHLIPLRQYITAGNATFTVLSKRTGRHFTFRASAAKDLRPGQKVAPIFIGVMTGTDNEGSYTHLGTLFGNEYSHGRKLPQGCSHAEAFRWLWRNIDALPLGQVEFIPSCKCCRCGRTLTTPESVAMGIGPDCVTMMPPPMTPADTPGTFDD